MFSRVSRLNVLQRKCDVIQFHLPTNSPTRSYFVRGNEELWSGAGSRWIQFESGPSHIVGRNWWNKSHRKPQSVQNCLCRHAVCPGEEPGGCSPL